MNTDRNEKINAKWKLRHEEKVSDKASVEFRAPFEEKEIQLPRLKFLRMIICHKLHPPFYFLPKNSSQTTFNEHPNVLR